MSRGGVKNIDNLQPSSTVPDPLITGEIIVTTLSGVVTINGLPYPPPGGGNISQWSLCGAISTINASGNNIIGVNQQAIGTSTLSGALNIVGNTTISGNLYVTNAIECNTLIINNETVSGTIFASALGISSNSTLRGNLNVSGLTTLSGLIVQNNTTLSGLTVTTLSSAQFNNLSAYTYGLDLSLAAGTSGSVQFTDGSGNFQGNNNFTYVPMWVAPGFPGYSLGDIVSYGGRIFSCGPIAPNTTGQGPYGGFIGLYWTLIGPGASVNISDDLYVGRASIGTYTQSGSLDVSGSAYITGTLVVDTLSSAQFNNLSGVVYSLSSNVRTLSSYVYNISGAQTWSRFPALQNVNMSGFNLSNLGLASLTLGYSAGLVNQSADAIAIGRSAGESNQGTNAIAIGLLGGNISQGSNSVAIGFTAGRLSQSSFGTAIGSSAGASNQGNSAVAIGRSAGESNQGANAIAFGRAAGQSNQTSNSIAIGFNAGNLSQGISSIAIGSGAGTSNQLSNAVAIGLNAGNISQGISSIAIGFNAGVTSQAANSIILSATGTALNSTTSGFFVDPVRNFSATSVLGYNPTTHEISYRTPSATTPGYLYLGPILQQWGNTPFTSGLASVTFPVLFSVQPWSVLLTLYNTSNVTGSPFSLTISGSPTSSNFNIAVYTTSAGPAAYNGNVYWFAVGPA